MKTTDNLLVLSTANAFVSKILERINSRESLLDNGQVVLDKENESFKLGLLTLTRLVGDSIK